MPLPSENEPFFSFPLLFLAPRQNIIPFSLSFTGVSHLLAWLSYPSPPALAGDLSALELCEPPQRHPRSSVPYLHLAHKQSRAQGLHPPLRVGSRAAVARPPSSHRRLPLARRSAESRQEVQDHREAAGGAGPPGRLSL
jgi:hypothetical protein